MKQYAKQQQMLRASLFEANLQKTKQETEIDIDTHNFFRQNNAWYNRKLRRFDILEFDFLFKFSKLPEKELRTYL